MTPELRISMQSFSNAAISTTRDRPMDQNLSATQRLGCSTTLRYRTLSAALLLALVGFIIPQTTVALNQQDRRIAFAHSSVEEERRVLDEFVQQLISDYEDGKRRSQNYRLLAEQNSDVDAARYNVQQKRATPSTTVPFSGGIYGKRASGALPYSGGIYGKRASIVPYSGGIYGKRGSSTLPFSGGIYGKRSAVAAELDYDIGDGIDGLRGRRAISIRASAVPLNGGFYGRRRR